MKSLKITPLKTLLRQLTIKIIKSKHIIIIFQILSFYEQNVTNLLIHFLFVNVIYKISFDEQNMS